MVATTNLRPLGGFSELCEVQDAEIVWGVTDGGYYLCTADVTCCLRLGPVPIWDEHSIR